jgi:hypothetical protein
MAGILCSANLHDLNEAFRPAERKSETKNAQSVK